MQAENRAAAPVELSAADRFTRELGTLVQEAESRRLHYMRRHRGRVMLALMLGMLVVAAGAGGFGWFLLMKADPVRAVASMVIAGIVPLLLNVWAAGPLGAYVRDHKSGFMPKLARALGNFSYHPARGISSDLLARTGVIPPYDRYDAEDCFMGLYKGRKVIFSEARLYRKGVRIFNGLMALIELPQDSIEGHTIVTTDQAMIGNWAATRWKKLQPVPVAGAQQGELRFAVFSDQPEATRLLVGEKFLKELHEASEAFDCAALTAVLFRGRSIFLMIPTATNMFEASAIQVPVATRQYALLLRREVAGLLEMIDIFDLYKAPGAAKNTSV